MVVVVVAEEKEEGGGGGEGEGENETEETEKMKEREREKMMLLLMTEMKRNVYDDDGRRKIKKMRNRNKWNRSLSSLLELEGAVASLLSIYLSPLLTSI